MKKYSTLFVVALAFAGINASAANKGAAQAHTGGGHFGRAYGTAGCGLGAMVIGKGDGMNQILAVTTNGTMYNQGFGITFGTLNCDGGNVFNKAENVDRFIIGNKVALASDIARGEGESITALASIMECSGSEAAMGSALQSRFKEIFPSHTVPAMEVTDSIINVVGGDAQLSQACQVIL
jgi:hypothetical protein